MATDVFYNGVQMHNVLTRRWDEEVVYDDSGADAMFTRFSLEFEGLIHLQTALADLAGTPVFTKPEVNLAATTNSMLYQQIRACLWEPRQNLQINFNGETVLEATHADDGDDSFADVDNGPKPRLVSLTHVCTNSVFRVRFAIETALVECCSDVGNQGYPANPQFVLNNRWSVGESMDDNFFTTRTIRGRLRASQSMAKNLHSLRPAIAPTLEQGFKRQSIDFTVSANGLEADYTIIDRQVHTAAPWPATKISGHMTESTQSAVMRYSEFQIRLEGPPHVHKSFLFLRACQICNARIGTNISNDKALVEEAVFYEEIGEVNAVELRCRLNQTGVLPGNGGTVLGNLPLSAIGQPLSLPSTPVNYDPTQSPVPSAFGYTSGEANPRDPSDPTNAAIVLYALRCFLQTPCDDNHLLQQTTTLAQAAGEGTPASEQGQPSETLVFSQTIESLPAVIPFQGTSLVSEAATNNIYRFAHTTSQYKSRRLRVGLPVAGDLTATSSDATRYVTLSRGQCVREIVCDAECVGQPPTLPAPLESYTDGGIVGKLLDHKVELFPSTLSVDGTVRIFRARGFYLYGLNRPPLEGESLLVGRLPFVATNQDEERVDPSTLYDPTLGPGTGSEGLGLIASE